MGFVVPGFAVLKDVEKPFDLVWHNGLRYKLMNSELPNKIIWLMSSFISDRTITIKINDAMSNKVKLNAGTPQGSVFSPLLFFMYANDIPVDPMYNQVKISQFADDLGMWTFSPNATYVQYRIHKTLSALEKWCSKWRIKLNAEKTQLIVLKQNGRQHKKIKLQLFGEEIDHVEEATLGVTITKTFNFRSHIKMAISKANRRLNLLRLLSGTYWGCKPKIIMQLYKPCVRPVLEYGAIALLSTPKTTLEKIKLVGIASVSFARGQHLTSSSPWRALRRRWVTRDATLSLANYWGSRADLPLPRSSQLKPRDCRRVQQSNIPLPSWNLSESETVHSEIEVIYKASRTINLKLFMYRRPDGS